MKCPKLYTFYEHVNGVDARIPKKMQRELKIEPGDMFLPQKYNKKKNYPERTVVLILDAKYILTNNSKKGN